MQGLFPLLFGAEDRHKGYNTFRGSASASGEWLIFSPLAWRETRVRFGSHLNEVARVWVYFSEFILTLSKCRSPFRLDTIFWTHEGLFFSVFLWNSTSLPKQFPTCGMFSSQEVVFSPDLHVTWAASLVWHLYAEWGGSVSPSSTQEVRIPCLQTTQRSVG